jgi:hypothetical protein
VASAVSPPLEPADSAPFGGLAGGYGGGAGHNVICHPSSDVQIQLQSSTCKVCNWDGHGTIVSHLISPVRINGIDRKSL